MIQIAISKILSANDTGQTGGHQSGILIPKRKDILGFFPNLGNSEKNPRSKMLFKDRSGIDWSFSFIYYNNKFFGGTRNEYRLTGMTSFIRQYNLKAGDIIILSRDNDNNTHIDYQRNNLEDKNKGILKLGDSWKVVNI